MAKARGRSRGEIEQRPSGAFRVRVYVGIDPVTKKRHYRTEHVPAGPRAAKDAEKVLTRLLSEVDEQRSPRTSATVNQLLDRYLQVLDVEDTTRAGYESQMRRYIRPVLGDLPLGRINGETLDAFYAELRRCRTRCGRRPFIEHAKTGEHECTARCRPHVCRPLGASYLRQLHMILNGAFNRAVKWRWVGSNPVQQAHAPSQPPADPDPPSAAQAARIVTEAWRDPDWGMFVWLAMTSGARRGELCALRLDRIDFRTSVLDVRSAIAQVSSRVWEKDTKTHQRRRIVLDNQTLALLAAYVHRANEQAAALNSELLPDAFMFSDAPDRSTPMKPDTATQRYTRMCKRLGLAMHLHQLRHYTATELIAAGVDARTGAGRLGHSGGGATTLRVYSAWVAEADQRASISLGARMPKMIEPGPVGERPALPEAEPPVARGQAAPYLAIAADLRAAIRVGVLKPDDELPSVVDLAKRYDVSSGTAHRAISLLRDAGEITVSRGRRATVVVS
ncbi:MAG: tyrosine-type recombinase/integrase [Actinomycetia bacterium]|nr:tyrosine-type recombinase/integrase [Actinomycetes bacterium]